MTATTADDWADDAAALAGAEDAAELITMAGTFAMGAFAEPLLPPQADKMVATLNASTH